MSTGARYLVASVLVVSSAQFIYAEDGQRAIPQNSVQEQSTDQPKFLGPNRCHDCHSQSEPRSRDFCQMNEALIIRKRDKHYYAYEALRSAESARIEEALAVGGKAKVDAWLDERCITCHFGGNLDQAKLQTNSGLTCEACHGPSEKWDQPHTDPGWRLLSPADKEKIKLLDMRHAVTRAKVCYSCHIGNTNENKVVTHAMYAGGHPPLTSLEIETFTEAMPRHWRNLSEKGNFQHRDKYIAVNAGIDDEYRQSKSVLVSGLVAMSESVRLVASQAQKPGHPEWGTFDCQACHHELRLPAWRQARQPWGRPGRPRPSEWPAALVFLADAKGNWREQVNAALSDMHGALDARPFGVPAALAVSIEGKPVDRKPGLADLLDRRADEIASQRLARKDLEPILVGLYAVNEKEFHPDFHSARQIAWAIRVIESELRIAPQSPEFGKRVDAETAKEQRSRDNADQESLEKWRTAVLAEIVGEVNAATAPLETYLKLTLNPDDKEFVKSTLQAMADYDPREFHKLLKDAYERSAIRGLKKADAFGMDEARTPKRR
jgi:hypothetical protein